MRVASAFSPGHITGLFQMCDQPVDPKLRGSRGAGVSLARGVITEVRIENSTKTSLDIKINGKVSKSPVVSEHVAKAFLSLVDGCHRIVVDHHVEVPIGHGFGASGAGALSLALALNEAFGLGLSRIEAAQLAHVAEAECKTGLGTVIAETFGGVEIRVKCGAPGIGKIRSIPTNGEYVVACLDFGPISTRKILTNERLRRSINGFGGKMIDELITKPQPELFMKLSRRFAESIGLISGRARKVLEETDRMGLTCSMAMFGDTVFSLVKRDEIEELLKAFRGHATSENNAIVTEIDFKGAHLLNEKN